MNKPLIWILMCPNGHKHNIVTYDTDGKLSVYCKGVKKFDKDEYSCDCEYSKWQKVEFKDII